MKRNLKWLKNVAVSLAVLLVMAGAGFYLQSNENGLPFSGSKVDAAGTDASMVADYTLASNPGEDNKKFAGVKSQPVAQVSIDEQEIKEAKPASGLTSLSGDEKKEGKVPVENTASTEAAVETVAITTSSSSSTGMTSSKIDNQQSDSNPVETTVEEPAAAPVNKEESQKVEEQPIITAAPVSYNWGTSASYTFRIEVKVTNKGSDTSQNVTVSVPLLENSSPYQKTSLKSTNYAIVSTSGRVSTFNLGDLAPGESKTIIADFDITVHSLSLNSSNETVDKVRKIYEKHAGSGNCRDLARAFINESRSQGINAREVIGFARPQRGAMTAGSLQGARHSWAEFYVEGLGWVPVDLTFQYFGAFPHTSHVVESYSDQSLKVNFTGGSLGATWSNVIL